MDHQVTIWISKEETDDVPDEPGSTFLEDPLKPEQSDLPIKSDPELKVCAGSSEDRVPNDPLGTSWATDYIKEEPSLNLEPDEIGNIVPNDPLGTSWATDYIKEEPSLNLEPDEIGNIVLAERETHIPIGYVQCQNIYCGALLVYKGSTSGMVRHKCKERRHLSNVAVSSADKLEITEKCVLMCASDLRPFNIVSGEGFINLAQELINVGAKYGQVTAPEVLPSPRTVARHIQDMADQIRSELIPEVKEAISKNQCSMTCDLWTDSYRKINYLTVTSSCIDESTDTWRIKNNILLTTRFPDVAKTGENIITEMYEQMAEISITVPELEKITFVTDQGANIKKALEEHKHIPCAAHCINTALRHTFNEEFLRYEIPAIYESILAVRNLVGFMKRSGLGTRLEKTLHQDVESRWNSVYIMLESFHTQKDQIEIVLRESNKHEQIKSYHSATMESVVEFLQFFKEATDDLEGENEPTLPFVVPWILKLLDHCRTGIDDVNMTKLKDRAALFLKEKVLNELHDLHYMSTFLHPAFKELLVLPEEEREKIYQHVRQMLNDVLVTEVNEDLVPSPIGKFKNWRSSNSKSRDEVDKYISMESPHNELTKLLPWWKTNAAILPKLSQLSKQVFCIPASSASTERNFSKAGLVVSQRRICIDSDRVNDILIVHNNKRSK